MGAPQYEQAGADIGGTGTTNTIPRWTGPSTLGDSGLIDNGTAIYTTTRDVGFGIASPNAARFQSVGVDDKWAARLHGSTTVGKSYGALIEAGTNSGDIALRVRAAGAGSDYLYVRGDGNVGIGTATPNSTAGIGLTIYQAAAGSLYLQNATDTARIFQQPTNLYIDSSVGSASGSIIFRRGSTVTESARIDSAGRLLVGLTASNQNSAQLQVSADASGALGGEIVVRNGAADAASNTARVTFKISANYGQAVDSCRIDAYRSTAGANLAGLKFWTYGGAGIATALTIDETQNVILGSTTGATIQAAGSQQGLKLPATPGSADTQTLDCYQEGTWTPTLANWGGTNPTITARYTRVGRLVTVCVEVIPTGGNQYSSTAATTTITLPSGMSAKVPTSTTMVTGATTVTGTVSAWTDGKIYFPTFGLTTNGNYFSITYEVA